MNALIFFFVWVFASLSGGDPCDNPQFAEAFAEECGEDTTAPTLTRAPATSVTDISNGF